MRDHGRPERFPDSDEVVAACLTAELENPDPDVFLAAVVHVAKAWGMSAACAADAGGRMSEV